MRRGLFVLAGWLGLAAGSVSAQSLTTFLHKSPLDWRSELSGGTQAGQRRSAAFALGRMGAEASPALEDLLRVLKEDPDESVREMAAQAIGDIVRALEDATPRLEWAKVGSGLRDALTKETSPRVRRGIVYAVGTFGTVASGSVPALRQALRDAHPSVRQNAVWAIGRVGGDDAGWKEVCELLRDAHPLVRRDAAAALGSLAAQQGREKLRGAVGPLLTLAREERDEVVRRAALGSLATMTDETHRGLAGELYPLLGHADREAVRAAAFALGNMGGEPARKVMGELRTALRDPDVGCQAVAAACLANAAGDALPALEDLARMLGESRHPEVRRNCAIAITRISKAVGKSVERDILADVGRIALPALLAAMKPIEKPPTNAARLRALEEVREAATEAVANIGYPHNEKAMPTIRELLRREPNQNVRQRCVWALFRCPELDTLGLTPVLTEALSDRREETLMVRYDIARVMAYMLRERAPDRVTETLLSMLENRGLRVFLSSGAAVDGVGDEGKRASSKATAIRGGDARYMAADALRMLGSKVHQNKRVLSALGAAGRDEDETLRRAAERALRELKAKE